MSKHLGIMQWKSRGLLCNVYDVNSFYDLCLVAPCLQETDVNDKYAQVLRRYQVSREDHLFSKPSGGVAEVCRVALCMLKLFYKHSLR